MAEIGFPLGGSGPYTCKQKICTEIYIRKNHTDHRTQNRNKTCKTIKVRTIIAT
jgi:hypothetical protein